MCFAAERVGVAFPFYNAALVLCIFSFGFFTFIIGIAYWFAARANSGRLARMGAASYLWYGLFQMLFALSISVVTARLSRTVNQTALVCFVICIPCVCRFFYRLFNARNSSCVIFSVTETAVSLCLVIAAIAGGVFTADLILLFPVRGYPLRPHHLWAAVFLRAALYSGFTLWSVRHSAGGEPQVFSLRKLRFLMSVIALLLLLAGASVYFTGQKAGDTFLLYSLFYFNLLAVAVFVNGFLRGSLHLVEGESASEKYINSKINHLDVPALIARLYELMDKERVYLDEELSLASLADKMGLNAHQLSEILNRELRINFNSFVNSYRLNAAKSMLLEEPDRTILSIALNCGFNSKTTFNKAFIAAAGMTPREFRRSNQCKP